MPDISTFSKTERELWEIEADYLQIPLGSSKDDENIGTRFIEFAFDHIHKCKSKRNEQYYIIEDNEIININNVTFYARDLIYFNQDLFSRFIIKNYKATKVTIDKRRCEIHVNIQHN